MSSPQVDTENGGIEPLDENGDSVVLEVTARDRILLEQAGGVKTRDLDDGRLLIRTQGHAGTIGLRDGPPLYLTPKINGTNLLRLLQYAQGARPTISERRVALEGAGEFVDLLATLYRDELARIFRQGPARSYIRKRTTEDYIRGQLSLHRQLQRQGPAAIKFECSRDDLTTNTPLNQSILYAGWVLTQATTEQVVKRDLRSYTTRLRRTVELRRVDPVELSQIELDRLTEYYQTAFRIAEMVIRNSYVKDLQQGETVAYSFTIPTAERFQQAVHRAISAVAQNRRQWSIKGPEVPMDSYITGGVEMTAKADTLVEIDDEPALVVDAKYTELETDRIGKWNPKSDDVHQMVGYSEYFDVPVLLVYPQLRADRSLWGVAELFSGHEVHLRSLPTLTDVATYDEYKSTINTALATTCERIVARSGAMS